MRSRALFVLSSLILVLAAAPARAQAPDVPAEVAERVIALYNAPGTIHFSGRTRIPAASVVTGDVAVLGGPLLVAGRIDGSVVVVNGDVELDPGAEITGTLTVVGGEVSGVEGARLGAPLEAYAAGLDVERVGDRLVRLAAPAAPRARPDEAPPRRSAEDGGEEDEEGISVFRQRGARGQGRSDFVVATGQSYNRVEGLPITFGPVAETGGRNPTRLRAQAIYRTEEGLALGPGRWGYDVRVEQFLGGAQALRAGVAIRSVVDPIEGWHLTKLENGLSTFFLHRDYRDHYERRGWSGYLSWAPPSSPLSLTAELRSERHESLASGSPWTLFQNDEPWRAQPLVAEGRLKSLALHGAWDTRSRADDPSTGWYVQAGVERALSSGLSRPEAVYPAQPGSPTLFVVPAEGFGRFVAGTLDVRRYNRISPSSRLNLRVFVGGSLDGSPLPPQRQHALGGEGSLPGYELFSLDCGARMLHVRRPEDVEGQTLAAPAPAYFPSYGCDRFALFQAEYRGKLRFRLHWRDDDAGDAEPLATAAEASGTAGMDETGGAREERRRAGPFSRPISWRADFGWVAFVDAGHGWSLGDGITRHDTGTAVDVGFGVLVGKVGIYGAIPLEDGRGVNLFVRLAPRF
jgi:hypothetical protein